MINTRRIFQLILISCMLFSSYSASAEDDYVFWIMPFDNMDPSVREDPLALGVAEIFSVFLSSIPGVKIIERQQMEMVLQEQEVSLSWPMAEAEMLRIGRLVAANAYITGSYKCEEESIRINAHMYDIETGVLAASAEIEDRKDRLGETVQQLCGRLMKSVDKVFPEDISPIDKDPTANLLFMQGLSFYCCGDYNRAVSKFIEASENESLKDIARFWLAKSFFIQKEYKHAFVEFKRVQVRNRLSEKNVEISGKLRLCEEHLSQEEVSLYQSVTFH
ncbi:MAG: hypothetical protein K8S27_05715 [Candidatus Omnitrophica bacterium]|nr:hypothetical protein [Candidatus Omnitrophota bacterium]